MIELLYPVLAMCILPIENRFKYLNPISTKLEKKLGIIPKLDGTMRVIVQVRKLSNDKVCFTTNGKLLLEDHKLKLHCVAEKLCHPIIK